MGVGCIRASTKRFPDGECYTRIECDTIDDHVVVVQNTYPDGDLVEMLLIQDAIKSLGAKTVACVIPYFGYARQDRLFNPGEPESAKVMARMLEMNTDHVVTVDLHKQDTLRWFSCPAVDVKAAPAIGEFFSDHEVDIVLSPDIGARSRAEEVGKIMGVDSDHLQKTRLSGMDVRIAPANVDVGGKNVLIVDDMISTGGTIVAASNELKKVGAERVYVACTHGLFVQDALQRMACVDEVVCCNTVMSEVSRISVAPLVAKALKETQ